MGYYDYLKKIRSVAFDVNLNDAGKHICHATKRECPYKLKVPSAPVDSGFCSGSCFKANDADREEWHRAIDSVVEGTADIRTAKKVSSHTPPVLMKVIENELGFSEDLPVYMSVSNILKSIDGKHSVSADEAKKLVDAIYDPIAVFRSSTHPYNSVVCLVEITDSATGSDCVVPVWCSRQMGHILINKVTSMYGKPTSQISNWEVIDKNTLYANMKKIGQYPAIRRALIARGGKNRYGQNSFLTENDFFTRSEDNLSQPQPGV
ncbi:MAG: hypothetical protein MJZ81_07340 [Bacteroidales bacterium]|nr:hypothetical protein [Bacteroidales bacterium]